MGTQILALLEQLRIPRSDHTALAHRQILVGKETPGRNIAEGTELPALIGSAIRMRAVFDELKLKNGVRPRLLTFLPICRPSYRWHAASLDRVDCHVSSRAGWHH